MHIKRMYNIHNSNSTNNPRLPNIISKTQTRPKELSTHPCYNPTGTMQSSLPMVGMHSPHR